MLKNILPAMVVLAIVSFYLKPKDSVPLKYEVESIASAPVYSFGSETQNLMDRIAKIERTDDMQFARFRTARWAVDERIVSPIIDDAAPQAEVQTTPAAPAAAAPVKSGGSNGSYSQSQPMQAAPMKSGGSNGSYSQAQPMQYSTPVYSEPQVVYSTPVYSTPAVQYSTPMRSGGSNGSYSTAAPVQYSTAAPAPRYTSVPVTTARVKSTPYKTVNRAVKSGGCTGAYSMQSVQVPVRGPVRKAIANTAARRSGGQTAVASDDAIVSPYSSAAPVSYSVQACAPMQMQYSAAPTCACNCGCPNCVCMNQVSADDNIVSPYSMSYSAPMVQYSQPGPIARVAAPVANFIDNVTPMRSSSPMVCTPSGCYPVQ